MTERMWNLALAVGIVACAGAWGWRATQSTATVSLAEEVYVAGERMPAVPGVRFEEAEQTLVLFASSTCSVCTDTMPFYRELVERIEALPSHLPLAVISFEEHSRIAAYTNLHRLSPDIVASVSPQTFKLRRTPTLILVGPDAIVKNSWVGRVISDQKRAEIFAAVGVSGKTGE